MHKIYSQLKGIDIIEFIFCGYNSLYIFMQESKYINYEFYYNNNMELYCHPYGIASGNGIGFDIEDQTICESYFTLFNNKFSFDEEED